MTSSVSGTGKSKNQIVNFDLPLSDSVRGKSTVDGLIVGVVQMIPLRRCFSWKHETDQNFRSADGYESTIVGLKFHMYESTITGLKFHGHESTINHKWFELPLV